MLIRKESEKLFYQFKLNPPKTYSADLAEEIRKTSNHIDKTWTDIEYLRFLYDYIFSNICNDSESKESLMLFNAACVLCKDFYTHFDIIKKVMDKLVRQIKKEHLKNKNIPSFEKKLWDKIRDIRNHIVIHKEKEDFYKTNIWSLSPDPKGMYILLTYTTKEQKKGKMEIFPLVDAYDVESFLKKFEKEFNNPKNYEKISFR